MVKVIGTQVDDDTAEVIALKAQEQGMTVSEYLRKNIGPIMEGKKPMTLEETLKLLEKDLATLSLCVKPLQDLVFDLQKLEFRLSNRTEPAKVTNDQINKEMLDSANH